MRITTTAARIATGITTIGIIITGATEPASPDETTAAPVTSGRPGGIRRPPMPGRRG